jgi:hypothetical protein
MLWTPRVAEDEAIIFVIIIAFSLGCPFSDYLASNHITTLKAPDNAAKENSTLTEVQPAGIAIHRAIHAKAVLLMNALAARTVKRCISTLALTRALLSGHSRSKRADPFMFAYSAIASNVQSVMDGLIGAPAVVDGPDCCTKTSALQNVRTDF